MSPPAPPQAAGARPGPRETASRTRLSLGRLQSPAHEREALRLSGEPRGLLDRPRDLCRMRRTSPAARGGASTVTTEGQGDKSILVVEDDDAARNALATILGAAGFRVAVAANGQDALGVLRTAPHPDLILLDLMMPVMDGWQF